MRYKRGGRYVASLIMALLVGDDDGGWENGDYLIHNPAPRPSETSRDQSTLWRTVDWCVLYGRRAEVKDICMRSEGEGEAERSS